MFTQKYLKPSAICAVVLLSAVLASCTWVKSTPESANVRLVPADRVADCARLGSVTTSTVTKVLVNRNATKVKTELETLAEIEASKMGGDTIVATSQPVEGRQSFDVYRCIM